MLSPRRIALLLVIVFSVCQCAPRVRECVFTGDTQGTTYTVKVVSKWIWAREEAAIQRTINARLGRIDETMSTYRTDSEISRFNQSKETAPFEVSPELAEVFQLALEVSRATDGAFDITVGPLIEAWGFGTDKRERPTLTDEELASLRARVGYQKISVDAAACTLRKSQGDVCGNLNAIAQGYTADKLASDLEELGYSNYMVEVGGEVKTRGLNLGGDLWRIGIEKPLTTARAIARVVALDNKALSTSGDYRNYYERDGVRVSHTIDPKTGRPVTHKLASVSVIHDSCALADAYATAFMVLGPEKSYDLAVELNLPALFLVHEAEDAFSARTTPAFPKR